MDILCKITVSVNLWYFTSEINSTFLRQSPSTVKAVIVLSGQAWRVFGQRAALHRCDHDVRPRQTVLNTQWNLLLILNVLSGK